MLSGRDGVFGSVFQTIPPLLRASTCSTGSAACGPQPLARAVSSRAALGIEAFFVNIDGTIRA